MNQSNKLEGSGLANIVGLVLVGGASSRFGSDKALARYKGRRLVDHAIECMTAAGIGTIIIGGPADYGTGLTAVADPTPDHQGPLAGLLAALGWADAAEQDYKAVVTMPVDCPDMRADVIARLAHAKGPVLLADETRRQATFGRWPVILLANLADAFEGRGVRMIRAFAEEVGATRLTITTPGVFHNINRVRDLG